MVPARNRADLKPTQQPDKTKAKSQKQPAAKPVDEASSVNKNAATDKSGKQMGLKRGQKSKLKKIKEKYINQDDDERELRMKLLQVRLLRV